MKKYLEAICEICTQSTFNGIFNFFELISYYCIGWGKEEF